MCLIQPVSIQRSIHAQTSRSRDGLTRLLVRSLNKHRDFKSHHMNNSGHLTGCQMSWPLSAILASGNFNGTRTSRSRAGSTRHREISMKPFSGLRLKRAVTSPIGCWRGSTGVQAKAIGQKSLTGSMRHSPYLILPSISPMFNWLNQNGPVIERPTESISSRISHALIPGRHLTCGRPGISRGQIARCGALGRLLQTKSDTGPVMIKTKDGYSQAFRLFSILRYLQLFSNNCWHLDHWVVIRESYPMPLRQIGSLLHLWRLMQPYGLALINWLKSIEPFLGFRNSQSISKRLTGSMSSISGRSRTLQALNHRPNLSWLIGDCPGKALSYRMNQARPGFSSQSLRHIVQRCIQRWNSYLNPCGAVKNLARYLSLLIIQSLDGLLQLFHPYLQKGSSKEES